MKKKNSRKSRSRKEQLRRIPDEFFSADILDPEFMAGNVRSREAKHLLAEFASSWGEGEQGARYDCLRKDISIAAAVSAYEAFFELEVRPLQRERAKRLKKQLDRILIECNDLQKTFSEGMADSKRAQLLQLDLVPGLFTPRTSMEERLELRRLEAQITNFQHALSTFAEAWRVPDAGPARIDPLSRTFIRGLAHFWQTRKGREPGHGRTGPFVRLVTCAWRLVGFVSPVPDDELESWIGGAIEQTLSTIPVSEPPKLSRTC